jgi:hypothetical protein
MFHQPQRLLRVEVSRAFKGIGFGQPSVGHKRLSVSTQCKSRQRTADVVDEQSDARRNRSARCIARIKVVGRPPIVGYELNQQSLVDIFGDVPERLQGDAFPGKRPLQQDFAICTGERAVDLYLFTGSVFLEVPGIDESMPALEPQAVVSE